MWTPWSQLLKKSVLLLHLYDGKAPPIACGSCEVKHSSFFSKKERRMHFLKMSSTWAVHFALFENVTPRLVTDSTSDNVLPFMLAFKSGSVTALPLRVNMRWTHLLGLRLRPLSPDHSDTYLRALFIVKMAWESLQGWPMTASSAYLRKEASDSE